MRFVGIAVILALVGLGCSAAEGHTPAPGESACEVSAILVPSCGAWWGIAPAVFTRTPPGRALAVAEELMGRPADILHVYHRGDRLFPTEAEIRLAREPGRRRILLVNWKPSFHRSWAEIAAGALDDRIDKLAAHITKVFPERFFLTVHHEPENEVVDRPGSGYTADDYRAMFRRVIERLRTRGVTNAITVMTYMGAPNWSSKPWFDALYPGDEVVDWIGMDPYADGRVADFAGLVDKTRDDYPNWPGFYSWAVRRFPEKPLMLAEWGVFSRRADPGFKERFFDSVHRQLPGFPRLKALAYFESPRAPRGDTRFDATGGELGAFRRLARSPHLTSARIPEPR
ncbi:glycoside hydrolase family 26 protein [Rhizohabitans arisaemae]|uniref:glycoside hydrolase family 26 protein n=1 Tax=Rhizohabitans arisaemae TaxID=2720610 RepID=UPI0024B14328|nr:glycosyl hydrolase [Rhizohabitans arisaemae]